MLPVFKDLANLSKKFTTKKSMPKDYVKTLKNHLDEAEGKLKQKHKVTPAELYEYTTAYHAYFIIKGDKKSEVPYHYDEKVYGVPRPALKEGASKSISMGMKSMEKPKGKSRKSSRTSSSRTSSSRTSSSSLSSKRISSPRISSSRISSPRMSKKKQTRAAKMPPKSKKKMVLQIKIN